MESVDKLLEERGTRYGVFKDQSQYAQNFMAMAVQKDPAKWWGMASDQREAIQMIFNKTARILNGDADYVDSWDDIAGYAKLVADRLRQDEEKE